jgi:hypothetical protein
MTGNVQKDFSALLRMRDSLFDRGDGVGRS